MTDEGGEAPCWAERVCDGCGAVVEPGIDHQCVRTARLDMLHPGPGADGVVWSLGGPRQLEANVVDLGPAAGIAEHLNEGVDVLILILRGSGSIIIDGVAHPLAEHDLVLVPSGSRRSLIAGADGIQYLSIHMARPAPTIRIRSAPN